MAPRRSAAGSLRAAAAVVVGVATSSEGILVASSSAAAVDTSTASALHTATITAGEAVAISAATGTFRQKQLDFAVRSIFGKDTSEPAGELAGVDVPAASFFAFTLAAADKSVTSSTFFPFPSAAASTGVINDAIALAPIAAGIDDAIRDRDTSTSPKCHVSLRIKKTTTTAAGRDTVDAGNTSAASRQGEYYSFFLADDANDDDAASSDELDGDHAILRHVDGPTWLRRHRSATGNVKTEVLIGLSVAGIVLSLASLFIFLYFNNNNRGKRRRRPWKHNVVVSPEAYQPAASSPSYEQLSGSKSWFTYDELAGITGGFAAANIAIGAARHPRIIHRDIKSANILIDDGFEAKVADFGLAKLTNDSLTHISTRVMGTFGYMAPEYASSGKLTDRSDVFSFGVVLLELITGRKPVDASQPLGEESLVEWARVLLADALETDDFGEVADPALEGRFSTPEMRRMVGAAAACVRHSAAKRPRMVQVWRSLDVEDDEGGPPDLTNGVKVGQSMAYDSRQYSADIELFRRMAVFDDGDDGDDHLAVAEDDGGGGGGGGVAAGSRAHTYS
nr:unnamed protein product [Digitaria exilis]